MEKNLFEVNGKKYAVYVGNRVSLAHQVQVHGPSVIGDDTFVGMKALVFRSVVGKFCVIEPGALLMGFPCPTAATSRRVPSSGPRKRRTAFPRSATATP